jgi:hypothetical protein
MAKGKSVSAEPPKLPEQFYARQLAGEQPPSLATMQLLYDTAMEFQQLRPWEIFLEHHVIAVEIPGLKNKIYCSIMGAGGEVFMTQCYSGPDGYDVYRRMRAGERPSLEEIYGALRSVFVEFVRSREITGPDREVLTAFGHRAARGIRAPIFRGCRPGYHPWYPVDAEARVLTACLRACMVVHNVVRAAPTSQYWRDEGPFPLVSYAGTSGSWQHYWIGKESPPAVPEPEAPPLLELDGRVVESLLRKNLPRGPVIQADCFFGSMAIGEPNQRKKIPRIAMCAVAGSGLALAPALGDVENDPGSLLAQSVLEAIGWLKALPSEIQVRSERYQRQLSALGGALSVPVTVNPKLAELSAARQAMEDYLG